AIDGGVRFFGYAVEHPVNVSFESLQFVGREHAFQDVEAVAPVGIKDRGVELAVGCYPQWSTIAERQSSGFSRAVVGLHGVVLSTHRAGWSVHDVASFSRLVTSPRTRDVAG